jgi:hypothetical protein
VPRRRHKHQRRGRRHVCTAPRATARVLAVPLGRRGARLVRGQPSPIATGFRGRPVRPHHPIRVPRYTMPDVPKRSAGHFAAPGMALIDLFIGSEGTPASLPRDAARGAGPAVDVSGVRPFDDRGRRSRSCGGCATRHGRHGAPTT